MSHTLAAWLVLLVTLGAPPSTLPPADAAPDPAVAWAHDRFEAGGLEPPDVAVSFHDSKEPCDGHSGLYVPGGAEAVHVCSTSGSERALRRILLHELGHAWARRHLDEDDRAAFVELRGLEEWAAPARWYLRGSEHAAEVLAWGLQEGDLGVHTVEPNDTESLREAFVALTGRTPVSAASQPAVD